MRLAVLTTAPVVAANGLVGSNRPMNWRSVAVAVQIESQAPAQVVEDRPWSSQALDLQMSASLYNLPTRCLVEGLRKVVAWG